MDEAYYEFCGVTALPEIERAPQSLRVPHVFQGVRHGGDAPRLPVLARRPTSRYLHKAQSPYSVNSLAVVAAQAAVEDRAYIRDYVAEVLAARELLCVGLEKLGHRLRAQLRQLRAGPLRRARHRSPRRACAAHGILVRDRSYEAAGLRAHHRRHARADPHAARRAGGDLEAMNKPLIVFDMDGVLVDVTESYRETIAQTVEHFTGVRIGTSAFRNAKTQGGWNNDWELSHHLVPPAGPRRCLSTTSRSNFRRLFFGNGNDGLILREQWMARAGMLERFERALPLCRLHGPSAGRSCSSRWIVLRPNWRSTPSSACTTSKSTSRRPKAC